MEKINVLICLPSLSNSDGIARVIFNYLDNILLEDYHIDFLCTRDNNRSKKYDKIIIDNNCKVYVIPKNRIYNRYTITKSYISKNIDIGTYDIVHINLVDIYSFACAKTLKNGKTKVILHSHNPREIYIEKRIHKCINYFSHRFAVKKSDYLFACSKKSGESSFKNNYIIIPNKIDVEKFVFSEVNRKIIRHKYNIDKNCTLIGTIARVTEQKNPLKSIRIFECFNKLKQNSKYMWIGSGNLLEEMKNYCNDMGLKEKVIFIDESENVEQFYSAFDIFLLPSQYEGFGNVFIESQSNGLPTLASSAVPEEVKVSELLEFVDLNDNIQNWSLKMKKLIERDWKDRKQYNEDLKKSIFSLGNKNELLEEYNHIVNEKIS